MKAMILAAGLGTRLKPFTDHHPKALALVNGKTLLEHNIRYLMAYGISEIVINVHHFAKQIIDFIERNQSFGIIIHISDESDAVLETGGGLIKAQQFLNDSEHFVLMNADILTNLNLTQAFDAHRKRNAIATLCVSNRNSSRALLFDHEGRLCGWENKNNGEQKIVLQHQALTSYAFSGIHILEHDIFNVCRLSGKFSMIDLYLDIAAQHPIFAYDHSGDILLDVGKPESIGIAEEYFK